MALFKEGRRNRRGQISKVPLSRVAHERKPRLHFACNSYELDHPFHIYERRPRNAKQCHVCAAWASKCEMTSASIFLASEAISYTTVGTTLIKPTDKSRCKSGAKKVGFLSRYL